MGKTSNFIVRRTGKITAFAFVAGFIESCSKGCNTYSSWAAGIGNISSKVISKQAIFDRMNEASVSFAKEIFSHAMNAKLKVARESKLFKSFNRVLLQDSTTLSLPDCLVNHFPGNVSNGRQKAVARLQCIINITKMQWLHLSLDAYTKNDQSASGLALPLLRKGDLLIRDLGYFVLDILQRITEKKAFFISRLRYGITIYDGKGKEINWKQLCKTKHIIDRKVFIGKEHQVPVRIILIPLPAEIAGERIRKAKKDRDKRLNHSKDYYVWLKYNVFITNAEPETLSSKEVSHAYKIRWQIEILFKSWKSGGNLQQVLHERCTNIYRVKTSIFLLLMFFSLIMQKIYMPYNNQIMKKYNKQISLIKLIAYIVANLLKAFSIPSCKLKEQLAKHCCYETRKDRINMTELIINF